MAKPMQSVDPTLLALQTANTVAQNAKKKVLPSLNTQAIAKPSLNVQTQQPQAIFTPPTAKVGGISSPFGASNINSAPILGGATPTEIKETATQLQSLPKAMPKTGSEVNYKTSISELGTDISKGATLQEIKQAYPEFSSLDDKVLGELGYDIANGATVEEIMQSYPELQGGGQKDNFITNLGSGIAGTASATGQLGKNLAFKAVDLYRTKVQGKEKLTPEQIANIEQSPMGQNLSSITNRQTEKQKESFGGKVGNVVGTLGQAFVMPTGVSSLSKIPVIAKAAAKAPLISSMIKGGLQGVVGQDQYTLMTEGRTSTAEERKIAGGLGLLFPLAGAIIKATKPFIQKGIKSTVNTLQTSGIINPAKFDQIKNQLIAEGVDGIEKATVDDVANFLTERGVKGTRQQQADILLEVADKSRLAKKEVLDLSTNLHAPDSAKTLAQTLVEELGNAKSQATKAIANKAQQLLNKLNSGGATLNEIDDLRAMGRKELNTRTSAGNVKISQQDVDNLIGEVRGYIEDAAQAEGLPKLVGYQGEKNLIKMLNNQTSTAKGLADGILRRDSTDAVQQLMTFMSARGGGVIAGGLAGSQGGVFDGNTTAGKIGNIAVGAFLGGVIDNPSIKSKTAQYLNKLTGTQKSNILKRMESGGKELLEREDKNVLNGLKNIIMGNNKEMPNSLPFKPNANITNNNITTSVMGNSNKAGVIPGPVNAPASLPKTPPITVEKGAIGMGTPKATVLPPKPTVAPSVSAPKVDTFKRMTELDSNPLYRKLTGGEILGGGKIKQGLFETPLGTITNEIMDGKVKKYIVNGKTYNASDLGGIREKQAPEIVAQANIASKAISDLKAIEKGQGKVTGSSLRSVLDELGIDKVDNIPEGAEAEVLKMVRARSAPKVATPPAPKKEVANITNEAKPKVSDSLAQEARKYKTAEDFIKEQTSNPEKGITYFAKDGGKTRSVGKVVGVEDGKVKMYLSSNPKNYQYFDIPLERFKKRKEDGLYFSKDKLNVDNIYNKTKGIFDKLTDNEIKKNELREIREQANKKPLPPLPKKGK